jgi:hypothetical protein
MTVFRCLIWFCSSLLRSVQRQRRRLNHFPIREYRSIIITLENLCDFASFIHGESEIKFSFCATRQAGGRATEQSRVEQESKVFNRYLDNKYSLHDEWKPESTLRAITRQLLPRHGLRCLFNDVCFGFYDCLVVR